MLEPQKPHKARILIAVGMYGSGIVLSTDSEWVANEADVINPNVDDIGIIDIREYDPGIYLWEGTLKVIITGAPWDGEEYETRYDGTLRNIQPEEINDLLDMDPPQEDLSP